MSNKPKIVAIENSEAVMDDVVAVDDVSVTYVQEHDCCESETEGPQQITLSTRNNGMSRFIMLKTERWSISDPQEIIAIIKDFCKRAAM